MIKIVSWDYWYKVLTDEQLCRVSKGDKSPDLVPDHSYREEPAKETRPADVADVSKEKK